MRHQSAIPDKPDASRWSAGRSTAPCKAMEESHPATATSRSNPEASTSGMKSRCVSLAVKNECVPRESSQGVTAAGLIVMVAA
jgi:hypothetical protein